MSSPGGGLQAIGPIGPPKIEFHEMEIPESFIQQLCHSSWIQQLAVAHETARTSLHNQDECFWRSVNARIKVLKQDNIPSWTRSYVRSCFQSLKTWNKKEQMMSYMKALFPLQPLLSSDQLRYICTVTFELEAALSMVHTIAKGLLQQVTPDTPHLDALLESDSLTSIHTQK